jgi:hypothetical protein
MLSIELLAFGCDITICFAELSELSFGMTSTTVQELDQEVTDANCNLIGEVFQRMGSRPGRLVTHYPRVAFIEDANKLAVVKRRGCKPRLALFALLKMLAPRYDPWALFYMKCLTKFLAACGVRGPSSSAPPQGGVADEGVGEGGEGPRRTISDSQNISQYEKAVLQRRAPHGDPVPPGEASCDLQRSGEILRFGAEPLTTIRSLTGTRPAVIYNDPEIFCTCTSAPSPLRRSGPTGPGQL